MTLEPGASARYLRRRAEQCARHARFALTPADRDAILRKQREYLDMAEIAEAREAAAEQVQPAAASADD